MKDKNDFHPKKVEQNTFGLSDKDVEEISKKRVVRYNVEETEGGYNLLVVPENKLSIETYFLKKKYEPKIIPNEGYYFTFFQFLKWPSSPPG
jgi:hypothetical protein